MQHSVKIPKTVKTPRVVKSPREAAIGVATLSGLIRVFLEISITPIITQLRSKDAPEAVARLLAHNKAA